MNQQIKYLTESYVPQKIFFREDQIKEIKNSLESYKEWGKGINLLLTGRSGSGKTSVLKNIEKEYNGFIRYTSVLNNNKRSNFIIRSLSGYNLRYGYELINHFLKDLNENPKALFIDEVDKCSDLDELMNILNNIYRTTQIPIILSTNNLNFIKSLKEDVRLTLLFKNIHFPLYNTPELFSILDERLRLANIEIPEDKKWFIAAISAGGGSARLLLSITYSCIYNNNFTEDFIKSKLKEFQNDDFKENILKTINNTERKILREILYLRESNKEINSKVLSQNMKEISSGRISQILTNLESLGLINTNLKNFGARLGQLRIIEIKDEEFNLLKDCKEI